MKKFREIASNQAKKYYDRQGLLGILWTGSSSFGIEDEYADIDIRLLIQNDTKSQPMEQIMVSDIKIEIDEMSWNWLFKNVHLDSEQAWIIHSSIILFDPVGKVSSSLTNAKKELMSISNKDLLWENYSKLYLHYNLEKSLKRQQFITAHIILSEILDALSKFIFLSKNQVIPPEKWRWYMIKKNKWFDSSIVETLVRLNLQTSSSEIILAIRNIQQQCQKIMLDKGFDQSKVLEPWRF